MIPYNNGVPAGVKRDQVHKMVNFIRQKSSDIKLNYFRPLDLSIDKFESSGKFNIVFENKRHSQSMRDVAQLLKDN